MHFHKYVRVYCLSFSRYAVVQTFSTYWANIRGAELQELGEVTVTPTHTFTIIEQLTSVHEQMREKNTKRDRNTEMEKGDYKCICKLQEQ